MWTTFCDDRWAVRCRLTQSVRTAGSERCLRPARYAWPVTRPLPRDPLANTTKLFVDGTNLLHAMTHLPGDRQPPAAVIGRLRGVIPPDTSIVLVFDGPTESGVRGERIAGGLTVRYSGRRSADAVILELVDHATTWSDTDGPGAAMVLVVTDDRDLRARLHRKGARTAGRAVADRPARAAQAVGAVGRQRPPAGAAARRAGAGPRRAPLDAGPRRDDEARQPATNRADGPPNRPARTEARMRP